MNNYLLVMLLTCLFSGCSTQEREIGHSTEITTNVEEQLVLDNESEYAMWLKKMHRDSVEINNSGIYGSQTLKHLKTVNDSVSYCIYEVNDFVCSCVYLEVFVAKKEVEKEQIGIGCDQDMANPDFYWMDYEILDDGFIKVTSMREFVADSLLTEEGVFPKETNFEDHIPQKETKSWFVKVDESGNVQKIDKI